MKKITAVVLVGIVVVGIVAVSSRHKVSDEVANQIGLVIKPSSQEIQLIKSPRTPAEKIVNGAKMEVLRGVRYDAAYVKLDYPGGDVPKEQGACTDVVIRSLRNAGFDLQKLVHEDMKSNFSAYPRRYGLRTPDPNIDHRRVPNLMTFFTRHGRKLPTNTDGEALATWQPGDIACWRLHGESLHCGIVSDARNSNDLPLVIHNIGGATQEDCLTNWEIIGHFRYPVQ